MSKVTNTGKLAQKFINQELTDEELITFKKEWEENPEFVKEVRDYSNLIIALKTFDRSDHCDIKSSKKISLYNVLTHSVIAAILVLSFLAISAYFVT